jgi:hypothetical protein
VVAKPEVHIEGLKEIQSTLRRLDPDLAKELKDVNLDVAIVVANIAQGRVPVGATGNARASVKAKGEQRFAVIKAGGRKAPYYGFLDFGNKPGVGASVGRNDSVPRPFRPIGRYLYPTVAKQRSDIIEHYVDRLDKLLTKAGL